MAALDAAGIRPSDHLPPLFDMISKVPVFIEDSAKALSVAAHGSESDDDDGFFAALQELVAYAFEESVRIKKKGRLFPGWHEIPVRSAKRSPTSAIPSSISTSRSARTATITTATVSAWRRCASRCAS